MNKNQKVVFEYVEKIPYVPMDAIKIFFGRYQYDGLPSETEKAMDSLTEKEQFEVLAEFAKWGRNVKTREELLKKGHSLDADSIIYSERLVKAILAAPTEEQMKCEYCHETNGLKERLLGNRLIYDTGYKCLEYFDFDKSERYKVKIYYCPHCGRKLGDE